MEVSAFVCGENMGMNQRLQTFERNFYQLSKDKLKFSDVSQCHSSETCHSSVVKVKRSAWGQNQSKTTTKDVVMNVLRCDRDIVVWMSDVDALPANNAVSVRTQQSSDLRHITKQSIFNVLKWPSNSSFAYCISMLSCLSRLHASHFGSQVKLWFPRIIIGSAHVQFRVSRLTAEMTTGSRPCSGLFYRLPLTVMHRTWY